jgi:hypothetical protein
MRKMVFTILGSVLLASSMVQVASAAEHQHRARAAIRATAPRTAPLDANAYAAPVYREPNYGYYYSGGYSAPAGR